MNQTVLLWVIGIAISLVVGLAGWVLKYLFGLIAEQREENDKTKTLTNENAKQIAVIVSKHDNNLKTIAEAMKTINQNIIGLQKNADAQQQKLSHFLEHYSVPLERLRNEMIKGE